MLVRDRRGRGRSRGGPGGRRGRPHLPVGRQARVPASGAGRERRRRGAARRPTSGARCWPAARPGRWSWPVTRSSSGSGVMPWPLRWGRGLGFASGVSVIPHYDAWPEPLSALIALQAPRGSVVLGIDEETAVDRPRRGVAGPRRRAGHGLARPPARAVPRRGHVPDLGIGTRMDVPRGPGCPERASSRGTRRRSIGATGSVARIVRAAALAQAAGALSGTAPPGRHGPASAHATVSRGGPSGSSPSSRRGGPCGA